METPDVVSELPLSSNRSKLNDSDWFDVVHLLLLHIVPPIPLGELPQALTQGSGGLETEVLLQRCGVGVGDRDVARLHRNQFLVRVEIVVGWQYAGAEEFLLEDIDEFQKVLRVAVTYIIYLVRRNRETVLAVLLLRGMLHDTDHALDDVVHEGEIAFAVAVVEDFYGVAVDKLVREAEICHVGTSGRTIDREKSQACGRNVVELRIGMCHQLVALFRRGIEAYGIVHLVVSRIRHLLVRTVNA